MKNKEGANSLVFAALVVSFLTACGSSRKTVTTPTTGVETVGTTSGTPQSTTVSTNFAAPLIATVTLGGLPVSGAVVTFAAPATGASGAFAGGADMATTNASGLATSAVFTANGTVGAYAVTASVAGVLTPASFKMTNTTAAATVPAVVATTGGTPQSVTVNTTFAAPLTATVTVGGAPVSGAVVMFTAPSQRGASGTFAGGVNTATTNASGTATSRAFTAGSTAGAYTVTASIADGATASFNLINTPPSQSNFAFYLSGQINDPDLSALVLYALAGSVSIDSTGVVLGGEQDYNDTDSFQSPEPSGDAIIGGVLRVNPEVPGQGTLTLITSNSNLGVNGTETLGVQFVNNNHALIIQYDGTATSSGSLDLQTLPSTLNGSYAFTLSGEDASAVQTVYGGVFSISGGTVTGTYDVNDLGDMFGAVTGLTLSGETISAPDSFGRGSITNPVAVVSNPLTTLSLVYYIVGPEAIRVIDVDSLDTGVGSAFGQGASAGSFSNASLGSSVFAVESNAVTTGHPYAVAGQFMVPSSGTISGFEDDNEATYDAFDSGSLSGSTYTIENNGYGSLALTFEDILSLGIYMTDPKLNLSDPNNPVGGGGALLAEMDGGVFAGTGVVIPQTDTAAADFTGNYAFGAQAFISGSPLGEFDFVGQGSVTSGPSLSGVGIASDPGLFINESSGPTILTFVPFGGSPAPDGANPGRYTMLSSDSNSLSLGPRAFDVVIYQASAGQLFWLDADGTSGFTFLGPIQQQGNLTSLSEMPPIPEER